MARLTTMFVVALLAASVQTRAAEVIAPDAKLTKLSSEYSFTEGPAADREGNVYFTDQPNDHIIKWNCSDGKLSVFMEHCGRANGLCFDSAGNLIACADEKNQLWAIDPEGKITVLVKDFEGKMLNGPNDVWVRPDGGIYFTDPYYKRAYWKRGEKEIGEFVYFLSPDHQKLIKVVDDFKQPNGIIGTADGKKLFIADIGAGKTYCYDISTDGTLSNKKLFCSLGSDGMTIDAEGNVYLTGRGVTVFDPTGKQIEHIDVQEPWTANICFGGKDMKTLFITASKSVYTMQMRVKGAGSQ